MRKKLLLAVLIALSFLLGKAYYQTEEKYDPEKLKKSSQEMVDSVGAGVAEARFICPRYLLRWAMESYNAKAKEEAIKVAEIAKATAELVERDLTSHVTDLDTRWTQELNDPKIKEKMITYTKAIERAAEEHMKYFQSGDEKMITVIDKYLDEAAGYDKEIEIMAKMPIDKSAQAIERVRFMCPRWFISWAEWYHRDVSDVPKEENEHTKNAVICADCVEIVESAKGINEIFEKEIMNIRNAELKEKWLNYIKAAKNMDDAFIEFYKTGDEKLSENAYKYQNEALAIEEEIKEYLLSLRQKQ